MTDSTPIQNNPSRNKFQILIAEDDISISNLLRMQLELAGYKVLVANGGNSAVDLISQNNPNFVIMDISMPELDGFEVIDKLKSNKFDTDSLKLVFLSNSSTPGDIEKAHLYGGDYKIKAELSPKELISFIDSKLLI